MGASCEDLSSRGGGASDESGGRRTEKEEVTVRRDDDESRGRRTEKEEVTVRRDDDDGVRLTNLATPVRVQRKRMNKDAREYIWSQTHGRCYICKTALERLGSWHIEHVVAFSLDPEKNDVLGNMLASCATCNLKKLDQPLAEVVRRFGCDLDTAAPGASHLNAAARECLLKALDVKKECYNAHRGGKAEDYLDAKLLDRLESDVEKAAQKLLPESEFTIDDAHRVGSGSFGEVYQATWRRQKKGDDDEEEEMAAAVKFPTASDAGQGAVLRREFDALNVLALSGEHPHVVRFYGLVRHFDDYGLVFEWCDFELSRRIVALKADLVELVAQSADALSWLHGRGYLHRDVKPMNILVKHAAGTDWATAVAKLADFGLAKKVLGEDVEQTHNGGTGDFRPPEVRSGRYYPESDVYSLGKTMQYLRRNQHVAPLFKSQSPHLTRWEKIEADCVQSSHHSRPTALQVRDRLRPEHKTGDPIDDTVRRAARLTLRELSEKTTVARRSEEREDDPDSVVEPPPLADSSEPVYVSATARIDDTHKGKKSGMKYHARPGCYKSWTATTLDVALRYGHEECHRCHH